MQFNKWLTITKPVMPVIVVNDVTQALPLADALMAGGIHMLEFTLRTAAGLQAIEQVASQRPQAIVGAGSVLDAGMMKAAADVGAKFCVSPGLSPALCEMAKHLNMPYLPGVATASDVLLAHELGFDLVKFFPAHLAGGLPMLKALAGPFPEMRFCPTGGVDASNMQQYLQQKNIVMVGGSWLCTAELLNKGDFAQITQLAAAC
jgi:2-dehydro-3-deoxyphosphogluconate aldolase / (4S)-4-hydroxy-2-oxoglutarate aldolase